MQFQTGVKSVLQHLSMHCLPQAQAGSHTPVSRQASLTCRLPATAAMLWLGYLMLAGKIAEQACVVSCSCVQITP